VLFNSYTFWVFFACVFVLYWRLSHRWQNRLLLLASYVFYGAWDWRFLSLVWISTLVDFFVARGIVRTGSPARRKLLLLASVCVNLGLLGAFKYFDFCTGEAAALLQWLGFGVSPLLLKVILPLGISFYTFQTMSYTIDVYRGRAKPTHSLPDFALFVCFFPQLVAGPIERYSMLMPQIAGPRTRRRDDMYEGFYHVMIGMFKKVVIADTMAPMVNAVFSAGAGELSGLDCLLGVYAFSLQIYGDFSGYSSIAQGTAKLLGFELMFNFRIPYLAVSPRDFWHRWHISLSTWLRDYVYISLGGSRKGTRRTYRNLLLTMFLGGLWHGAGWTFVAWGMFHGLLLCVYRLFGGRPDKTKESQPLSAWRKVLGVVVMFHLTCIAWLLFRADSIPQAWEMFCRIFTDLHPTAFSSYAAGMIVFFGAPLVLYEAWLWRRDDLLALLKKPWPVRAAAYAYLTFMMWFFHAEVHHEFIYFQF